MGVYFNINAYVNIDLLRTAKQHPRIIQERAAGGDASSSSSFQKVTVTMHSTPAALLVYFAPQNASPPTPPAIGTHSRGGGGGGVRTGCRLAPSPPSPRWVFKTAALTARVLHQMDSPDRVRQPETVARVLRCGNRKVRPGARSVGRGRGCQKAPGEWCQRCNRRT